MRIVDLDTDAGFAEAISILVDRLSTSAEMQTAYMIDGDTKEELRDRPLVGGHISVTLPSGGKVYAPVMVDANLSAQEGAQLSPVRFIQALSSIWGYAANPSVKVDSVA